MTKQITTQKVRTEIARLIRQCRRGARTFPRSASGEREAILLLQELADNLGLLSLKAHPPDHYLVGKLPGSGFRVSPVNPLAEERGGEK